MRVIKYLRKQNDLSQKEFLDSYNSLYGMNLGRFNLLLIENGFQKITPRMVSSLAEYYGVTKDVIRNNDEI
ncbi:helix-turn-helix domain-containing protein [Staphylococcus equorum]|uniref:helix-turn-helix domain-containing protein n=1 Tax=Staphylococcus equorum TaxID=246432 RepID=UPI003D806142